MYSVTAGDVDSTCPALSGGGTEEEEGMRADEETVEEADDEAWAEPPA